MLFLLRQRGFTLIEALVSIIIVGGIFTIMYSGFDVSNQLQKQAVFESEAAFIAEREMEYVKSELIEGRIEAKPIKRAGFLPVSPGWQVIVELGERSNDKSIKINVETMKDNDRFKLGSYIYVPEKKVKK